MDKKLITLYEFLYAGIPWTMSVIDRQILGITPSYAVNRQATEDIEFKNVTLTKRETADLLEGIMAPTPLYEPLPPVFKQFDADEVCLSLLTPFQGEVYLALRLLVKAGRLTTYKELASMACHPTAIRAVATAVKKNPWSLLVPCHRVIRSNGDLGGYAWGPELKLNLLRLEGCPL